jgi:hypothetical protein|nr:MAG TPA: hypothetical protein [Caudoviricetes sp.]
MILGSNDVLALCTKLVDEEKKKIDDADYKDYTTKIYFYEICDEAYDIISSTCKDGFMLVPIVLTEHIIALKRADMCSDGISVITDAEIKRGSIIRIPNCIVSSPYWIHGICNVLYKGDSMNFDFISYDMQKTNTSIRTSYDIQHNMMASYMQPYPPRELEIQLHKYANGGNK